MPSVVVVVVVVVVVFSAGSADRNNATPPTTRLHFSTHADGDFVMTGGANANAAVHEQHRMAMAAIFIMLLWEYLTDQRRRRDPISWFQKEFCFK